MGKKHVVALAAVVAILALPVAVAAADAPPSATIASSNAVGFRAVVTATKSSAGRAPTANVYVAAFEKTALKWRPLGLMRVGRANGFFWKVVTRPHSVGQFAIDTSSPEHVTLQLLVSPALGWSPVYTFHVEHGRLVSG